jgi:UDP-N-acetylglucosamine--N-acetylmuramyl-(pentapeptide) pyrophosphoryl-undecaprenol N-acetylglucosamine transferase
MKILIAAGGTGGHIYPGIAIGKEIVDRNPDSEVLFVGTARGLEKNIVPEHGFQLSLINSSGLKNVGFVGKLKGLIVLPRSFMEARKIIRDFSPSVVVGAGGYVSGPVVMTAYLMRIPTLIMDSNALPGFTNRRLARFVDKAALTFEAAKAFFGDKGVVTGNPVRKEFFEIGMAIVSDPLNLLIFGGSQGSQAINNAMMDALPLLIKKKDQLRITHQTGEYQFEEVRHAYSQSEWENARVTPYISNMVDEFENADLILSRAGATTCAEVAAAGRASLMVPLPTAADDHQRKNAEAMAASGAGVVILQSELSGERLAREIEGLIAAPARLKSLGQAAKKMARPDAAAATVDLIEALAKGK